MSDAVPPFTVAIPTYNGTGFVRAAVGTALGQGDVAFELLVCDDRSTDDTLDQVHREAGDRVRIEVNSERLGLAGNWNRCVELARTPFVAILHQDDTLAPDHLATHLAAYGPTTGLVASAVDMVDKDDVSISPQRVERGGCGPVDRRFAPGEFARELAVANPLRCSAVTLRREAHASVGGFDSSYRYVVDWDFWLRASEAWEVAWVAKPTAVVRWHSSSETHAFSGGTVDLEETSRLLESLYSRHPDLAEASQPRAGRRLARAYVHRAYQASKAGRRDLVRLALGRAWGLDRRTVALALADPRLAARLGISLLSGKPDSG
jgi:GT2 family glycosyltransferase